MKSTTSNVASEGYFLTAAMVSISSLGSSSSSSSSLVMDTKNNISIVDNNDTMYSRHDVSYLGDEHYDECLFLSSAVTNLSTACGRDYVGKADNVNNPADTQESFFDTYFSLPRFGFETAVSIAAATPNVFILTAIPRITCRRSRPTSVYNILFANLAVANCLSTCLLWLANNMIYLFGNALMQLVNDNFCHFIVHLADATFVSMTFGLVTTLTMLGFSTVQYSAICRPLEHRSILRRRKVVLFLVAIWVSSIVGGFAPLVSLSVAVKRQQCGPPLIQLIATVFRYSANISAGLLAAVHVIIFTQCLLIYRRMSVVRREMTPFRYARDMRTERRAIVTIVILLLTLNFFFVPYTVMTLFSLNSAQGAAYFGNSLFVYYMNLLPHFKCMADPLVYGLRMRELQQCCWWFRNFYKAGRCSLRGSCRETAAGVGSRSVCGGTVVVAATGCSRCGGGVHSVLDTDISFTACQHRIETRSTGNGRTLTSFARLGRKSGRSSKRRNETAMM